MGQDVREQELNKKLAKWAGISLNFAKGNAYLDFPSSLDACFKWLVPKLRAILSEKECFILLLRWVLHMEEGKEALALCKAIERLIDDKV